jgi:hypothetical protein
MATAKKTTPTHSSTIVQTTTTTTPPDTSVLSLQTFDLLELQQFTKEKVYSTTASKDFHLFYVGRDDVHDILKYVLSRVTVSLYLNMFGFDDDELNAIIMEKARDPPKKKARIEIQPVFPNPISYEKPNRKYVRFFYF